VLSLPPAFVLSQDQTLKLDMRFNLADHYIPLTEHTLKALTNFKVALKNVAPTSSLSVDVLRHPARKPSSTFLFLPVNLSNSRTDKRSVNSQKLPHPTKAGWPKHI